MEPNSKVTDVEIYPYSLSSLHGDPYWGVGPVIVPVVKGGHGTYVVELSGEGASFALDITGGTIEDLPIGKLAGGEYVAKMTGDDGEAIVSPTLTCTAADDVSHSFTAFLGTLGSGSDV